MIIKISLIFLRKKASTRPKKNQYHKQSPNSLLSGTNDRDMLLILRLSILGSLELLEDIHFVLPPRKNRIEAIMA
jgi:hypothetical protein